jgi:fructose-bisphosphate aldolase class 1
MARPLVADGGDGPQIWNEAVEVLNKQSGRADKPWSFSLGFGRGANNSVLKNNLLHTAPELRALENTVMSLRVP